MDWPQYQDELGPVERRMSRLARAFRWAVKSTVGAPRTILVEQRWRLGDEVMALPIYEALHSRYPDAQIAALTNYPELFEGHPFAHAVVEPPAAPDRCILLRGAPRTAYRLGYYSHVAGIPLPLSPPKLCFADWDTPLLAELPRGPGPIIAFAPGTTWPTKQWVPTRWTELAATLEAEGARIIELGTGHPPCGVGTSFVGRTSVRDAACLLHAANLLVSCDNGLMHLALAAGTPVIALFGITDPGILVRNQPLFSPVRSTLPCSGYWNRHGVDPTPGVCPYDHPCCLDDIAVGAVRHIVRASIDRVT